MFLGRGPISPFLRGLFLRGGPTWLLPRRKGLAASGSEGPDEKDVLPIRIFAHYCAPCQRVFFRMGSISTSYTFSNLRAYLATSAAAGLAASGASGSSGPDTPRDTTMRESPGSSASRITRSTCSVQVSGFRVQGSGFRVQGSGFRVQGSPEPYRWPRSAAAGPARTPDPCAPLLSVRVQCLVFSV